MILGRREGRLDQFGAFGQAGQVVLLLFGAGPELALEGHPRRVERHVLAVGELDDRHAVVEVVGGDGLDA